MFKVNNKDTRTTSLTLNTFQLFSSVSIVDFEQVIVCWVMKASNIKFGPINVKQGPNISLFFLIPDKIL